MTTLSKAEIARIEYAGPSALRSAGCTCTFGCRNCGMHEAMMGNCPAWNPCPMGLEPRDDCPLHGTPAPGSKERGDG